MTRHVVVLTGWSVDKFPWEPLFNLLEKKFNIIFVDWKDVFTIDGFKKKVLHLISTKKITNFSLIGWSLGSITAIEIAQVLPEKIDKLILISGTLKFANDEGNYNNTFWSKKTLDKMIQMLKDDKNKTLNNFYRNLFSKSEKNAGHYKSFFNKMQYAKIPCSVNALINGLEYLKVMDLKKVFIPHSPLLIHGSDDIICPYQSSEYIKGIFKTSILVKLQHTGHIPFYTKPNKCYEIIEKYLEVGCL